jgi:hypothetical protein
LISNDRQKMKFSFSGHESFPFRYGWLQKGIRFLDDYPNLYLRDDAMVILGVGKNMVRSIRYWCETLNLITSPNRGVFEPTMLGKYIFGEGGWDPYMEDPATLWLLHWKLVSNWEKSSTWYLIFMRWIDLQFSKDHLMNWLWEIAENNNISRVTRNSIKRDVDVFLRTYLPSRNSLKTNVESTYDCPIVELGLIEEVDKDLFSFVNGPKPSLPDEVFIFSLLEYWNQYSPDQNSISYEKIRYGEGGIGRGFLINDNNLFQRLEKLPSQLGIQYDDTAGKRGLYRDTSKKINPFDILSDYYSK